jgi:hypothetical protein
MGRDELSGSIFGQHFLLVTSPDSDGTVLPFDRGPAKLLTASVRSLKLLPFDRGPTSHLPILQAILEISFKMMILFRYSSYRNYLLRYMYINFLGNRPQDHGEWQKLHSHAYTCATVCSFVSFTHYLIYLRRQIAKKIHLWHCLFALFVSFSQLIIVIWIKTSVDITTVFHTGISRAVAAA